MTKSRVLLVFCLGTAALLGCEVPSPSGNYGNGPATRLDMIQAASAAVMIASCVPDVSASELLRRFYAGPRVRSSNPNSQITAKYSQAVACLSTRPTGCQGVSDCLSTKYERGALCGSLSNGCSGNTIEHCASEVRSRIDCTRFGLVCSAQTQACEEFATLGQCNHATDVARCDGGRPLFCSADGFWRFGPRCDQFGLACAEGKAECEGRGVQCAASLSSDAEDPVFGCEGAALLRCVGGKVDKLDCGKVANGATCKLFGSGGGNSFCGTATDCSPGSDEPRCDKTALLVCNGGKTERVDCLRLGFAGCDPDRNRCVPSAP